MACTLSWGPVMARKHGRRLRAGVGVGGVWRGEHGVRWSSGGGEHGWVLAGWSGGWGWCWRRRAGDPERVVDVVSLGRAEALGSGDDGVLGGFGAGVARREPAGMAMEVWVARVTLTPLEARWKEDYLYALAKPHGSCRGSSGSNMHKQIKNQNRDIKHRTALK